MNDLRLVEIVKAAEHVIDYGFHLLFFKVLGGLEQLLEVHIALVKHEVHIIEVFQVLRLYDTLHLVEARVLDAPQDAHLSEQALGPQVIGEDLLKALHSISFLRWYMNHLHNFAVGSFAQFLYLPELVLWQLEVLIQLVKS